MPRFQDPKAKREFELVREAFAVLKKPELRYEYDVKADVEKSLERRAEEQVIHCLFVGTVHKSKHR